MKQKLGLRLHPFSVALVLGMVILCICLLYTTRAVSESYDGVIEKTEKYVQWTENAEIVHAASEYLTEQARLFAQTADRQYMENYFLETYITQRRTKILDKIHTYYETDAEQMAELERAIYESKLLTQREYYSMKLICMSAELAQEYIPPEIQETALKMGDTSLSPEELQKKGCALLYDAEYQEMKDSIYGHLDNFTEQILTEEGNQRQNSVEHFFGAVNTQRMFIGLLILLEMITLWVLIRMLLQPLLRSNKRIREHAMLDIVGAEELRILAREYNTLYETLAEEAVEFQYRPENDPLTGVMHQDTYHEIADALRENKEPMALVLFRMDDFAALTVRYDAHTIDWMLKKAGALLTQQAELKDHVFRIDRAEFAAIFMNVQVDKKERLTEIFHKINEQALLPEDSLPAFSLSAGVAFSEEGWQKVLAAKAREALRKAREKDAAEISFYED